MEKIIEFLFGMSIAELTMPLIIAQVIGLGTTVVSLAASQCKRMTVILLLGFLANLLLAFTYTLTGGGSGALICYTACIQTIVSYFYARKERKIPLWLTLVFLAMYLTCSAVTYKNALDILTAVCSITYALAVVQSKSSTYRIYLSVNSFLWIVYDIAVKAYTTVLTHVLLLAFLLIAIVRYDIRKQPEKVEIEK